MELVLKHNLPWQLTTFVGRADEITALAAQLDDAACRLLTIVGPGGMGKTRLAIEVARRKTESFAGVYFVPLAPIIDPRQIPLTIVEFTPLQIQDCNCDPRGKLFDYLHDKRILLVLDNFEHVLEGVGIVTEILEHAPNVKIVVTSREALNLKSEWLHPIAGLTFPHPGDDQPLEPFSAVQLFFERAHQVRATLAQEDALNDVIRICQQVDGMPLALELAASWLKTLTPADIAGEISRNVDILTTRSRDVSERHRSIRAVFNHSWALLTAEERDVFRKLSIFQGHFTREAAQAVAGASLHQLASLVDKSLVVLHDTGRYSLHELLRQYGKEELHAAGQAEPVKDAHAAYYLNLLRQFESDLKGRRQIEALDDIEADFENSRAAWHWAVKHHQVDAIDHAVESINFFCDMRARYQEGIDLLRLAWESFSAQPSGNLSAVLSRIRSRYLRLIVMGNRSYEGELSELLQEITTYRSQAERLDRQEDIAYWGYLEALTTLTFSVNLDIPLDTSQIALLERSQAIFQSLGDRFYVGEVFAWLASAHSILFTTEQALPFVQQSHAIAGQIGDRNGVAWTLYNLALGHFSMGNYEQCERDTRRALACMEELKTIKGIVLTSYQWVLVLTLRGELETARRLAEDMLRLSRELCYVDGESCLIGILSLLVALMEDDYATAAEWAAQSKGFNLGIFGCYKIQTYEWGQLVSACGLGDDEAIRLSLADLSHRLLDARVHALFGLAAAAVLCARTHQPEKAVEYLALAFAQPESAIGWMKHWKLITHLREQLEAELDPEVYAAAERRGRSMEPQRMIQQLVGQSPAMPSEGQALIEPLTERELDVLRLLAEGLSNREIAERLVLSVATVKVHTRNIYAKLDVSSRSQAILRGSEMRLLVLP